MALPTSGPLSIGDIRTELGSTSGSLRTLSAAAGKSTPDAISEFYGYSAMTPPTIQYSQSYSVTGSGTTASPYSITLTGSSVQLEGTYPTQYSTIGTIQFYSQTTGSYRVYLNVTARNMPGLSDSGNGFYLYASSPFNAAYYGVERGAGSDSALAAINLATEVAQSTNTYSVGQQILNINHQVYNNTYFDYNSLTFTVGFELI